MGYQNGVRIRERDVKVLTVMALLLIGCKAQRQGVTTLETRNAFPNLTFNALTDIQAPPDGTTRLFAVEQRGIIRVFPNDSTATSADVFLDIQRQVTCCGERGLLGMAFHPAFATNGLFYVYYTTGRSSTPEDPFRSVVSRFSVSNTDPNTADLTSEFVVLEVEQPYGNHNAGQLQFGPDGYLYVGLGDGGSQGDPQDNGEDPTTLYLRRFCQREYMGTGVRRLRCYSQYGVDSGFGAEDLHVWC